MRPLSQLLALALTLCCAAAIPVKAGACETVIVYRDSQPETRAWVSGHYEWIGDTWAYVPGHWIVTPARCQTTEVERCGETIVYADPPPCRERVVVVEPACRPVYRECAPVVVSEPRYCAPPRRSVDVRISAPLLVPVPLPLPFPFFRHHH